MATDTQLSALTRTEALPTAIRMETRNLSAFFGRTHALKQASLELLDNQVTAIIGPSGCGKSTLLRCLNRMHETVVGARTEGEVLLDGEDIYAPGRSPVSVRRVVGMVFQRPTPFPTMSIADNVAAGLAVAGRKPKHAAEKAEIVEKALRSAALWDEVKDRLRSSPLALSGGQQQRLCIARTLATEPEVMLLDE